MSTNSSAVARTKLLLKRPNRGRLHQSGKPITADQLLTSYATNVGIGLGLCGRAPGAPFGPGRCFHSAETAERPVAPNLTQQSPSVPEMPGAEAIHLGSRAIDADTIGGSRGCGTKAERKRPPA